MRKKTRQIKVGDVLIGGDAPVSIQSMCNTFTHDVEATVAQIKELEAAGCEIIRVTVPDVRAAEALPEIRKQIKIPLVADIHFDHKLAIMSAPHVDKLRINPGNIGSKEKVQEVVDACKKYGIPIRIGVNAGSLEKDLVEKYGRSSEAMIESGMRHIKILEELDFYDIAISLKASTVNETLDVYEKISEKIDYPLHVGVTEAGTAFAGTIKSSIGIGALLAKGIGDTIRVSLTDNPVEEIKVGIEILKALNLREGRTMISCPTCGRTEIDLIGLAKEVEIKTAHIKKPITIAVMGCVVNGPGEASHADYGVAGGKGCGLLFKNGETVKKVDEKEIVPELLKMLEEDGI